MTLKQVINQIKEDIEKYNPPKISIQLLDENGDLIVTTKLETKDFNKILNRGNN